MQELVKQRRLNIDGYLDYTADIYRLAARNVWCSVLLNAKEYRQKQTDELYLNGVLIDRTSDFQLVAKHDNPTMRAFSEASVGISKGSGRNSKSTTEERRKGPFLPDGREICRSFNYNSCFRNDCKMMHICAICFSSSHSTLNGHGQPMTKPKNQDVPGCASNSKLVVENKATSAINTLNFEAWCRLLPSDTIDQEFILVGAKNGFKLSTKFGPHYSVNPESYSSKW
ncbi:unnamed protein product [Mytilus coruscus]|uniref:C3H1-type domain-containing protein n=1 Tax=Mytilus coruscus TaxID=42192 RepID=A0A6J8DLZ7_MYTCO|nr:unnamed protein product [Mytilus coruscus]